MSSRGGYGVHSASGARPLGNSLGRSRAYAPAFRPPQQAFSADRFHSANRFDSRNRSGNGNRFGGTRGRDRDRHRGFRDRDRGFVGPWRFGYPGWYGYYDPLFYDPYWWWDSSSSYDSDTEQDIAQANEMNEQSLEEQRARDSDDNSDDQDVYARSNEPRHSELTAPSPPTTLVFRDQHKQEIQNYAIVGHTLWSFSAERTEKIPLSEIDIPATTKVNDDRGVNFKVPGEGQ
jgi:hypothetical protein